ncbi:sensor histidine kinase [Paenibacillus sp. 2KB_22]|uniref:sensor histidine kinase n=1 Tax=Paenibacillus sp. 2KB_22 TaxID=3232978 RepID=UPI003F986833
MRIFDIINNISLRKKIIILFILIGIIPLVITFFISYGEIRKLVLSGQNYAEHQNFEQMIGTLQKQLSHVEELSAMIMVNKDMEAILSEKPDYLTISEQMGLFNNMVSYTQMMETNSEIDHIVYFVDDQFIMTGTDTLFRKLSSIQQLPWAQNVFENKNGISKWVIREEKSLNSSRNYLALASLLWNPHDFTDPVGVLTLNIEIGQIAQNLTKSNPEQLVYIVSKEGELVASNGDANADVLSMRLPQPIDSHGEFQSVTLNNNTYLARGQEIGETGLYLMSVISHRAASEAVSTIRDQMVTVYLFVSILLILVIFPAARSVTRRIYLLMNKMSQVRQGRLNQLDIPQSKDEVGQLIASYNFMIKSVQELMSEQFKLGQEKNEAELRTLQSQINPHFLYNTLDMLNWMAKKEESENIQQVVYALSDYYKLVLNKGEDLVNVRDEVRLSEMYMEIQRRRFRGRIQFEIDVSEDAMNCLIPKITLQPLVENAIIHGINEKPNRKGEITIIGRIEEGRLKLFVVDNGIGIQLPISEINSKNGSGYGVKNIEKRLMLFFGQSTSLDYHKPDEGGTRVTIDVPAIMPKL